MVETQYSRFTLVSISSTSYSQLEILIVILPGLDHTGEIEFGLSLIARANCVCYCVKVSIAKEVIRKTKLALLSCFPSMT